MRRLFVAMLIVWGLVSIPPRIGAQNDADPPARSKGGQAAHAKLVAEDEPVFYLDFDEAKGATVPVRSFRPTLPAPDASPATPVATPAVNDAPRTEAAARGAFSDGVVEGTVKFGTPGPRPSTYPTFSESNLGATFGGKGFVRFADPGNRSPLDFTNGDAITIEAWVAVSKLGDGQTRYIVGKGRTNNPKVAADNQNYALRLVGRGGSAGLSFLFRDSESPSGAREGYHRWDTEAGLSCNGKWHHIAVTYLFGDPKSMRGYVDGKPQKGEWSYGGPTEKKPVVDNDELWVGHSMGKAFGGSTFDGQLDELAIYRKVLSGERIAARAVKVVEPSYVTTGPLPKGNVLVEVMEGIPDRWTWDFSIPKPADRFEQPFFAMQEVPHKYNGHGVRTDRTAPYMVRMTAEVTLPKGPVFLLLRSRNGARVSVDGEFVGHNSFPRARTDGHNELPDLESKISSYTPAMRPGVHEAMYRIEATGRPQRITYEVFVGGQKRRPEISETALAWSQDQRHFELVTPGTSVPFTPDGWEQLDRAEAERVSRFNQDRRAAASTGYAQYWEARHAAARDWVRNHVATSTDAPTGTPARSAADAAAATIDRLVTQALAAAKLAAEPSVDDWAFLRRVSLDLVGTHPQPALVSAYFKQPQANRREWLVDQLLADRDGWAANWVGYWQDVLAENPNLVNPTLNNTGPFRYWIHESFLDNKPYDRFATELILMEGSTHFGGTAGFELATENDAPFAAKANIISQAFLALEMKCARCHDAPYHDFDQKDLFSLAAMLRRGNESVPKTSTIPPGALNTRGLVEVTLKPGEKVPPVWPFAHLLTQPETLEKVVAGASESSSAASTDTREQLARFVTAPHNRRFAQVIVNRVWHRLLGRGLVEPVDDWEQAKPSIPDLLTTLERDFVEHGYDLKRLTRSIVLSHTYQRAVVPDLEDAEAELQRKSLFAGPTRRRLSAEQMVDTLFAVSGKSYLTEEVNIDTDNGRFQTQSLNLGFPVRAWQFGTTGNERDRPSLSLPGVQTFVTLLETFGWRGSRQDPLTVRPNETTVLQPALLANGTVARRITQFSEESAYTALALEDRPVVEFVERVVERIVLRPVTPRERARLVEYLEPGYTTRIKADATPGPKPSRPRETGVSWSNHLKPEANQRKLDLERELELGDPPTTRLDTTWRERAEDVVWTLINLPEFVLIP